MLDGDDDEALCEAGEEFGELDSGANPLFGEIAGLESADWETRGELGIVDLVSGWIAVVAIGSFDSTLRAPVTFRVTGEEVGVTSEP